MDTKYVILAVRDLIKTRDITRKLHLCEYRSRLIKRKYIILAENYTTHLSCITCSPPPPNKKPCLRVCMRVFHNFNTHENVVRCD